MSLKLNRSELFRDLVPYTVKGQVKEICGEIIRAVLPGASPGALVTIEGEFTGIVTAFSEDTVTIAPLRALRGIRAGAVVELSSADMRIPEIHLGRILSSTGELLTSNSPEREKSILLRQARYSLYERDPTVKRFFTGVPAIDALFPIAEGQRILIAAEPGIGKTTLLDAIARGSNADIVVYALIGERSREAAEFLKKAADDCFKNGVAVVSTSDETPLGRVQSAELALSIAEYWARRKKRVLLLFDSLTRFIRAKRDLQLAAGELPVRRGYPSSVFTALPALLERCGSFDRGSITAFFTMLLPGENEDDPMLEEVKGILDGHLLLRRRLAERGVFPAISLSESLSRLAGRLQSEEERLASQLLQRLISRLESDRDLALFSERIDPELHVALTFEGDIEEILKSQNGQIAQQRVIELAKQIKEALTIRASQNIK